MRLMVGSPFCPSLLDFDLNCLHLSSLLVVHGDLKSKVAQNQKAKH